MQNANSETSVCGESLASASEEQIEVAELSDIGGEKLRDIPIVGSDHGVQHWQEVVFTDSQVLEVVASEPKRQAAKALKRRRASLEFDAEHVSAVLPVVKAMDSVETDFDDLALLDWENRRLKQLLAEYLGSKTRSLRQC